MPSNLDPKKNEVLYVPLGGAGEIGMNMYLYGHAGRWMMVDCGMGFAHDGIPGIELMIPDPDFILQRKDNLVGLVITHAHEDHVGAIPFLAAELECPIYATEFTAAMIKTKLEEAHLTRKVKVHIIKPSTDFSVGPFDLRYIPLTHSIPDNHGLVIITSVGTIFHTGDWKLDAHPTMGPPSDLKQLRALGQEGVLAMMCDSTNVFEPGRGGSETDVAKSLKKIIAEQTGKVAITMFASNVARLKSVIEAGIAADRHVVLAGRSLRRVFEIATHLGMLEESSRVVDEEDAGYFPDNKVLYVCTGCQGERRSAMSKIADRSHKNIKLGEGDTVIFSSREIPGNEISISFLQNALARQGLKIITAHSQFTHVSGHPYRDELSDMYAMIKPKIAIPMHGELRHLMEHAAFAETHQCQKAIVAENGHVVRITSNSAERVGEIAVGKLALDGDQWISLESEVLREKHKFTWNGAMVISVALDKKYHLAAPPMISLMGVIEYDQMDEVCEQIADAVEEALEDLSKSERQDEKKLTEKIRLAAQKIVQDISGKKPIGRVHIMRV